MSDGIISCVCAQEGTVLYRCTDCILKKFDLCEKCFNDGGESTENGVWRWNTTSQSFSFGRDRGSTSKMGGGGLSCNVCCSGSGYYQVARTKSA